VNQLRLTTPVEPDLEVDFLSSPALIQPRPSLSGTLALPPLRAGLSSRANGQRSCRNQRRNWAFASPDDVLRDIAMKGILNLPDYGVDGEDTRSASSVGRYYERMLRGGQERCDRIMTGWVSERRWKSEVARRDRRTGFRRWAK